LGNPDKARVLGNTRPGDGYRFRGGGLMQTTGGANYRRIGQKIGVDLYGHPEYVLSAEHALKPALIEWTENKLNDYADRDDVLSISKAINLGNVNAPKIPNGLADRQNYVRRYKQVIDSVELHPVPAKWPSEKTPSAPVPPQPQPQVPQPTTQQTTWQRLMAAAARVFRR
jgi:hypothetical protein